MKRSTAKARIDMRATPQDKHYLEMAAFIAGYRSLTDFILEVSKERADELLADATLVNQLSEEDSLKFMEMCRNAPPPNKKLQAAYDRITSAYSLDSSNETVDNVPDSLFKQAASVEKPKKKQKKSATGK